MHSLAFSSLFHKEICNITRQKIQQNSGREREDRLNWCFSTSWEKYKINTRMAFLLSEDCRQDDNSSRAWTFKNQYSRWDGHKKKWLKITEKRNANVNKKASIGSHWWRREVGCEELVPKQKGSVAFHKQERALCTNQTKKNILQHYQWEARIHVLWKEQESHGKRGTTGSFKREAW